MIAVMSSAYLTLILVIIYYLIDRQNTNNPVDKVIVKGTADLWPALFKICQKASEQSIDAIEDAILTFNEQQLVTGIGMLVSGYTQQHCSLSLLHVDSMFHIFSHISRNFVARRLNLLNVAGHLCKNL